MNRLGLRLRPSMSACVAALAAAVGLAAAPAASAEFVVKGRGFGHGIGLSAYGAYGYAKHGRSYESILAHYYKGTRLATVTGENVRVLVGGSERVFFSGATRACGEHLKEKKRYRFERSAGGVALATNGGTRLAACGKAGGARGGSTVTYAGYGDLRGELLAVATGGGLNAVNRVDVDEYVKGVVPNEVPSSWPGDALKAQAVAARSIALSTSVDGDGFDLYDDTRSQVYEGKDSETAATNRIVKATAGEVVKHNGKVAVTYYSSTSGGRTENVEFGFPGAEPVSYLKSVRDPYDDTSPYHRWRETFSRGEMESRLSGYVNGRLKAIDVTKTGISPRIVEAKVRGTGGSESISGPTLQSRLGLLSTWAKFKRK